MSIVLFTSNRDLDRAENLKSVYDAYDGEKEFIKTAKEHPDYHSGKYSLQVTDELPDDTPGKCIFIGHGMGAGKTYGLDQPRPYFSRPDLITYAIASSENMVPIVAKQCGIPDERVIPLGMPRTDAYFKAKKNKHPSKCHLYAPTFRAGSWKPDFNKVKWNLPEGHRLMVKPHMVTGRIITVNVWDNIDVYSSQAPTTPYLLKADTLITDYSSIVFDAMVLRKPTVLFAKDRKKYLAERGMYFPYPEMYSKYFYDREEDMAQTLEYAEWDDRDEYLRKFYVDACDGKSIERTLNLIRSVL